MIVYTNNISFKNQPLFEYNMWEYKLDNSIKNQLNWYSKSYQGAWLKGQE